MKRFKNILFVADRERGLDAALERAARLSQSNAARLTVMDVMPDAGLDSYLRRTYEINLNAQLKEQRLGFLDALTRPYTDAGVPIYTTVATGTLFLEVIRAVQRNGHDLVMKVAQHKAGLAPTLLGSGDMHLLRKCPCPVWIDRPDGARHYRRLLAAVNPFDDGSGDLPRLILDLATSLAAREDAALQIIHTWELPGESMLASGRGRVPRDELYRMLDDTEARHRQELDALLLSYGLNSGAENVHLVKGHAARTISAYTREHDIDLVVMGTLGRAGIPGLLIGNTAEDVLRDTQTSVLAAKPGGFITPVR
jgi:universal stress protein E